MLFEIKHRYNGSVLFDLECGSLKLCLQAAVESGANLYGANLSRANLSRANLYGADLSGANLYGANLYGANLSRADLSGANLSGANLYGADLYGADLYGADLSGANLSGANLSGASLDIKPATQEEAVANLDRVREIILDDAARLDMGHWHSDDSEWKKHTCAEEAVCGTTHCLAGWLQVCSTDEKIRQLEPALAGTLLAPCALHTFTWGDDQMLAWLKEREYAKAPA